MIIEFALGVNVVFGLVVVALAVCGWRLMVSDERLFAESRDWGLAARIIATGICGAAWAFGCLFALLQR